jgi:type I restriction-modification system DNA methylase subunit/restriction endonuclease S subunit
MGRSTVHYADNKTNNALKALHNKLRPAGTPVQRVEYIIELLLLRIFETKIKQDDEFKPLRDLFSAGYKWLNPKTGKDESNENRLFSYLPSVSNEQILSELNDNFFPFYSNILQSARKVFAGNLPQKVQDQLVLIEEVFSNSNFTNNVNSGNLGEVISIIANDIEESRLLQTDLLGDAIESALSETGGTKDIGLFRTPSHIRQFMTALVEPTFDDVIFDPACGTGGFLFDAFEFVMRRVDSTREWPGEKANSELAKWFDRYFEQNQIDFPSIEQTTQFYRGGVTGVEYLGMIRKMAAINFYIRGLNPANIEQGDSLAKYKPVTDHESKTAILANPPFGAQRDQEAYPDVWSEYSKESETTILFVKLMFEHLKQGGRCAVVVSEGFHTWDQFSAKALRKMLLEEAQLKAVISLPQGLFVSKSGQGPKTSILVFEKGASPSPSGEGRGGVNWTWFYKVTNDGYTMGTNRKEQKGNQLVECLTLFHEYVKHGKQPPESKNQFCIPAEWIKTLDPRVKEKIRTETRADMEAKGAAEREKKSKELDKKVKAEKLTEAEKQMELKVFEQMLENRIQNEIAKRIDKAHNYSFNLANYKSSLNLDLFDLPDELDFDFKKINDSAEVDKIYKSLQKNHANPETAKIMVQKLNLGSALEADIAREYVSNLDNDLIAQHKELSVIKEILKSGAKYPKVKLGTLISLEKEFFNVDEETLYRRVTCKLRGQGIFPRDKVFGKDLKTKRQQIIRSNQLLVAEMDAKYGGYGIVSDECDNAIVSSHYYLYNLNETEILPSYLGVVLQSEEVLAQVKTFVKGTTNYSAIRGDDFLEIAIPLPSLDEQIVIVAHVERQKAISRGVTDVIANVEIDNSIFSSSNLMALSDVCHLITDGTHQTPKYVDKGVAFLSATSVSDQFGAIDFSDVMYISEEEHVELKKRILPQENDILLSKNGTIGKSKIVPKLDFEFSIYVSLALLRPKTELVEPKYLLYALRSSLLQDQFIKRTKKDGGVGNLHLIEIRQSRIPVPPKIEQLQIIENLDSQTNLLQELYKMKTEAEKKIAKILADVWGVEVSEPVIEPDEMIDYD